MLPYKWRNASLPPFLQHTDTGKEKQECEGKMEAAFNYLKGPSW